MSDQVSVKWHLIPDGSTSIVRVSIEGQFTVSSANATTEAEAGIAALVARISTEDEATIQQKLLADVWLGDHERPDEPAGGIEEPNGRARAADDSSVPPRWAFFLAVAASFALWLGIIFGVVSLIRFLQEIWGAR